ncbi:hypothetical protein ACTFIZ_008975 [Dictyostelium cf. discoideum]
MSTKGLVPIILNAQSHLRTTSNYNGVHTQMNCIINFKNLGTNTYDGSEGWSPSITNNKQYIISGCENPRTFKAIAIQGRGDMDQWVTSYTFRYSLDNINWMDYNGGKPIEACTDRDTINTHFFSTPLRARSIALHPKTWHGTHICLRWELYADPQKSVHVETGSDIYTGDDCLLNRPGVGKREVIVPVKFDVPFGTAPRVNLTLDHIDCVAGENPDKTLQIRCGVQAQDITTTGFNAVFYTWEENLCYSLRADYIATSFE